MSGGEHDDAVGKAPRQAPRHASWSDALARERGTGFWRSLDDLMDTPEFRESIRGEFPATADVPDERWSRRSFMKLLGASVALAGLGACIRESDDSILAYVDQPPEVTPGVARYYATSLSVGGYAMGVLAESHVGRPTKIEGNPLHPASLGATSPLEQASVLQLYDPDRLRSVRLDGARATWGDAIQRLFVPLRRRADAGAGVALLLEPTSSPLVAAMLDLVRERLPRVRIHFHDALAPTGALDGSRRAFGRPLVARYDLTAADVIVAAGSDLLARGPFHVRYAHDFAERRRISQPSDGMSRLYVAEAAMSITGGMADHRLRIVPHRLPLLLGALHDAIAADANATPGAPLSEAEAAWLRRAATDLRANAGRSLVAVGDREPAAVHVLAHAINARLGNVGRTVSYAPPAIIEAGEPSHDPAVLTEALRSGTVDTLLVLGGNPAYASPSGLQLEAAMRAVPTSACLTLHENETAEACHWRLPAAHYLEAWGDGRAYDGTVSFTQPLIAPLWAGRTVPQLLAMIAGVTPDARALLRDRWRDALPDDEAWNAVLRRGLLDGSATAPTSAQPDSGAVAATVTESRRSTMPARDTVELVFEADRRVHDGRYANNAWLQELPDPITKLTWMNAAQLAPATAVRLGIETGQLVRITLDGRSIELPALAVPGHADDVVTIPLGYGRRAAAESVAHGHGTDAFRLWGAASISSATGASLERLSGSVELPITQDHWSMEDRPVVLSATLEQYRGNPDFTGRQRGRQLTLYEPYDFAAGDQWAMVVDLSLCTGCSACVVACQAENNIPVVGPDGVRDSREMHWMRIDRYFGGDPEEPTVAMQPMLCQHCEKAPCEYVCPVNATVHSPDGLNEMVYNRCVGTRFCSNNCPYKVRRFNWFDYNGEIAETERLVKNPDVTVRERGVMEKCTFCVQRIRRAQQDARVEGHDVAAGPVVTACQQSCPTRAITFGSFTNPDESLLRRLAERRRYEVLHDLGTRPRVTYLARISNPGDAPEAPRA